MKHVTRLDLVIKNNLCAIIFSPRYTVWILNKKKISWALGQGTYVGVCCQGRRCCDDVGVNCRIQRTSTCPKDFNWVNIILTIVGVSVQGITIFVFIVDNITELLIRSIHCLTGPVIFVSNTFIISIINGTTCNAVTSI